MEWGLKPQEVSHPDGQPEWICWWMAQVDVDTQAQAREEWDVEKEPRRCNLVQETPGVQGPRVSNPAKGKGFGLTAVTLASSGPFGSLPSLSLLVGLAPSGWPCICLGCSVQSVETFLPTAYQGLELGVEQPE